MHEFSIAQALLEQVRNHAPAGSVVRCVVMEVGPLQGIDPEAMRWAWQAATAGSPLQQAELQVHQLPWRMECETCGREWSAADMEGQCACGSQQVHPSGGSELLLRSLTVDDESERVDLEERR